HASRPASRASSPAPCRPCPARTRAPAHTGTMPPLMRIPPRASASSSPPCPAPHLVPQHRQLLLTDIGRRVQLIEVHAARHLLAVVVAAVPIDVVRARVELAVRERADQAAGDVVHLELHL